jgi:hypothetical protein
LQPGVAQSSSAVGQTNERLVRDGVPISLWWLEGFEVNPMSFK